MSGEPTLRADIDGDGRPDRVMLAWVRHGDQGAPSEVLRLSVRTASGKGSSLLVSGWYEDKPWYTALQGAGAVDGVRGQELLVGVSDSVGHDFLMATWRKGKLAWLSSPRSSCGGTTLVPWGTDYDECLAGYTFRTSRGVRYVDALDYAFGAGYGPDHGTVTTYRWAGSSWRRVSSHAVKNLPAAQLNRYVRFIGTGIPLTWARDFQH